MVLDTDDKVAWAGRVGAAFQFWFLLIVALLSAFDAARHKTAAHCADIGIREPPPPTPLIHLCTIIGYYIAKYRPQMSEHNLCVTLPLVGVFI